MKELKELGFEYLPTLNDFRKKLEEQEESDNDFFSSIFWCAINKYGDFIDKKPKLGDFIPCIDGVPVDEPKLYTDGRSNADIDARRFEYQKALEQVKFEGWKFNSDKPYMSVRNNREYLTAHWMVGGVNISGKQYNTYEHAINEGVKFKIK